MDSPARLKNFSPAQLTPPVVTEFAKQAGISVRERS
jgi:hypothetical protein